MPPPPPPPTLNLDRLRLLLMQSGTTLLCNTCDKTIITLLNFKISGGEGEIPAPSPPLYKTLMVYLLGSELGLLLCHGNPSCTLRPLPLFTAIWPFPPFAICHQEVNDVISKISHIDKAYTCTLLVIILHLL